MAATPRLTFLYPAFIRPFLASEAPVVARPRKLRRPRNATFTTTARRREELRPQRYGPAVTPPPHLENNRDNITQRQAPSQNAPAAPLPEPKAEENRADSKSQPTQDSHEKSQRPPEERPPEAKLDSASTARNHDITPSTPSTNPSESEHVVAPPPPPDIGSSKPLETVLQMPSPSESQREEEMRKIPHLDTPKYVHHFDTFTLVRRLGEGGFKEAQAITTMKAVRAILADNMELARAGLVSKSNVENETYLFRAACSELRTEIQNSRKIQTDKNRAERNLAQHEVDILGQRIGQETSGLKDNLKGMFDDRKMAVRMEQKKTESRIQELNYAITVALNSDARSEVEGLRWVLTRRAAAAIAVVAITVLATLRYSTYMQQMQDAERKKMAKKKPGKSEGTQTDDGSPKSVEGGDTVAAMGRDAVLMVSEGTGEGFVSMG